MARRKKLPSRENHERWLVSYADFITLLFAFFVVMFASSQTDKGKAQQMSDSIKRALKEDQMATAISGILGGAVGIKARGNSQMKGPGGTEVMKTDGRPGPTVAPPAVELAPSLAALQQQFRKEIEDGMLEVHMEPRGLVVSLRQATFFPPGQDAIALETYPTIEKLASLILRLPNKVRLEGHTDSQPIHNARYRSNWELSSARGVTMLEMLSSRFSVPESRMSVGGYGDTSPLSSNETAEGRAQNRRVDILLLNETGLKGEPAQGKKK